MVLKAEEKGFLSGNALKVLAALFMVCDHVGMLFFFTPGQVGILRYVGRIAYPIFAFFIAEGCRYTKNRAKYLGLLAVMGLIFHIVYATATGDDTVNVIVSFALAVGVIYLWQNLLWTIKARKAVFAILSVVLLTGYVLLCYAVCKTAHIDYLFAGILLPWWVYLTKNKYMRLFFFALGIVLVALGMKGYTDVEIWGLLAVPIMALYNGKRGRLKMKYFFYIFYPVHLVLLYAISMLVFTGKLF